MNKFPIKQVKKVVLKTYCNNKYLPYNGKKMKHAIS